MCLFSLSWNTCGFSAPCHAAGGPSEVPLLADSGWLLYSCGDGFAWGWGLTCNSCPVPPPCFSFLCLRSFPFRCFPFGVLALTVWIGMSVSSLLVYSSGWLGGVWLRPLPQGLQRTSLHVSHLSLVRSVFFLSPRSWRCFPYLGWVCFWSSCGSSPSG